MSCFCKTFPFFKSSRTSSRVKFISPTLLLIASSAFSGPEGGQVVGGAGSIERVGDTTTILQETDRMAIDWQSYDVGANERVHYIQPDSSSLSLNRILSNNGSQILGRIDANGHVILVNPNGIIFGENATINAGGLLASGLTIDPQDFLNGEYAFSAIDGTDGSVINRGMLNASLGGSVSLLGKRVENDGLISADLGSVTLAAGEGAVVTFDDDGLMGLRVTEAVLQSDLGVDPAVVNNGEISSENGQVLISASVSEDIFSDAVNHDALELSSSVVVHDDGSFTLGDGADVVNAGIVDVSGENSAGEVVVLGENVTNSGDVRADISGESADDIAGAIEIHSRDTTFVSEQGLVSAVAHEAGQGGDVKILGDNVGLIDDAVVNASGANGGGQVLVGGDETGANPNVRNAQNIFLGEQTLVSADATDNGDGGRVITFAENTARIYGDLSAIGGLYGGNGGFVETSGLYGFEILTTPSIYASNGLAGEWLIDPVSINIVSDDGGALVVPSSGPADDLLFESYDFDLGGQIPFSQLAVSRIVDAFAQGGTVTLTTGPSVVPGVTDPGNIVFQTNLNYSGCTECVTGANRPTLILDASNNIDFNGYSILGAAGRSLNIDIGTFSDRVNSVINSTTTNSVIQTGGGDFDAILDGDFIGEYIDINSAGGDVQLVTRNSGVIRFGDVTTGSGNFTAYAENGIYDTYGMLDVGGLTTFTAYTSSGIVSADSRLHNIGSLSLSTPEGGWGSIRSSEAVDITYADVSGPYLYIEGAGGITNSGTLRQTGSGTARFIASSSSDITLTGVQASDIIFFDAQNVTADITGAAALEVRSVTNANITAGGNITHSGSLGWGVSGQARFDVGVNSITLDNPANNFGSIYIADANNATIYDANSIVIDAALLGAAGSNTLTINANGNITGTGQISANRGIFDTNGAGFVSLTNPANELDRLSVGSSGTPVTGLTYDDVSGLMLEGIYVDGSATIHSGQTVAGLLHAGGTDPDISITGAASFVSSGGAVNLGSEYHNLGGDISVNTTGSGDGGDVFLRVAGPNDFGVINTSGNTSGAAYDAGGITIEVNGAFRASGTVSALGRNGGSDGDMTINGNSGANSFYFELGFSFDGGTASAFGFDGADSFNQYGSGVVYIDAGDGNDIFSDFSGAAWSVDRSNGGQLGGSDFRNVETLYGRNAASNTFNIVGSGSVNRVVGEGVSDTLVGPNGRLNRWDIDSNDDGDLNGIQFDNIENLTGGDEDDYFDFTGSYTIITPNRISGIIDGMGGDNTIETCDRCQTNWTVDGENSGRVENVVFASISPQFRNVQNLVGGDEVDQFIIEDGGSVSSIQGGDEVDVFNISTRLTAYTTRMSEIQEVEDFRGNNVSAFWGPQDADNIWTFGGGGFSSVAGITFINFSSVVGGGLTDEFNLQIGGELVDSINGGGGSDTIIAGLTANDWDIRGENSGDYGNGVVDFESIENLHGLGAVDTFEFHPGGSITESIDGGTNTNRIYGRDDDSTWLITDENEGSVAVTGSGNYIESFSNITQLFGGTGDDDFDFTTADSDISGSINGGGHGTRDEIDFSAQATVSTNLESLAVTNVENIRGNGTGTLTGPNGGTNTWIIDDTNNGIVNGINFFGYSNLTGGNSTDVFTILSGGVVTGTINGAGGSDDEIQSRNGNDTWRITANNEGEIRVTGESTDYVEFFEGIEILRGRGGDDTFAFSDGASFIGDIYGGGHTNGDVLSYADQTTVLTDLSLLALNDIETVRGNGTGTLRGANGQTNTWLITDTDDGVVDGFNFEDYAVLIGGDGVDTFTINDGVDFTGSINGGVDAASQNTLTHNTDGTIFTLASANGGQVGSTTFSNIGVINGSDSTLNAFSQLNEWRLSDPSSGSINTTELIFTGMENLQGGTGVDRIIFEFNGAFSGTVDAGSGASTDVVDVRALGGSYSLTLGDAINNVTGAESVIAATGSTLSGLSTGTNVWTITGANTGSLSNGVGLDFDGFTILQGSASAADQFIVNDTATFVGEMRGGADADLSQNSLTQNDTGSNTWTLSAANNGTIEGTNFSNMGVLNGSGNDTLNAFAQANQWDLDSNTSGNINTSELRFTGMQHLNGGAADDDFIFGFNGSFLGDIDAGGQSDEDTLNIVALGATSQTLGQPLNGVVGVESVTADTGSTLSGLSTGANVWTITGANAGSVSNGIALDFDGFTILQGSDSAADQFTINDTATFSGELRGGADADLSQNTLTHNGVGANVWTLSAPNDGTASGTDFNDIGIVNGSGNDTLTAFTQANQWDLDSNTSGNINTSELRFTGMQHLNGGAADDDFIFGFNGSFLGDIDAGGQSDEDTLNIVALGATSQTLGQPLNGVVGVESVTAGTGSTLLGLSTGANVWTITGANAGSVSNGIALDFDGFTILQGSDSAADQFTINDAASFTGEMRGGADVADNILTNNNSAANTWTLSASNTGTVSGTSFSNIRTINGVGNDTLVASNQSNTWTIDGANSGDINSDELIFTGMQRLTGNDAFDEFIITSTGSVSGLIDGAGSGVQDRLNLTGIDAPVNVRIGLDEDGFININNIELIDRPVAGSESSVLYHSLATVDTDSYTWVIDGVNSGNVAPTVGANIDNTIYFTNFGNAVGGIGEDLISYVGSGALTSFNGGGGSGSLTLNYYATSTPFDITIGETFEGVDSITINPVGVAVEDVQALLRISATDTTANEWTIDGLNSGSVDTDGDAAADFTFTNFNQLFGGTGDDTFTFDAAGDITGQLVGGAGTDTNIVVATSGTGLTFQFDGDDAARDDATIISLQDILSISSTAGNLNTVIGPNQTSAWSINPGNSTITGGYTYSGFDFLEGNAGVDTFQINGGAVVNIDGGGNLDVLVGSNQSNGFIITGVNEGTLNGVAFDSIENLHGNDGVDTFTVQGGTLAGTANGLGGDQDRVIAPDAINVWVVDGPDAGSLSGVGFDGVEILQGGALRDTFRIRDGGSVDRIEAGGTDNVLDLGFRTAATEVDLQDSDASGVALFIGISSFIANPGYSNTLIGQNVANIWEIDAANEGEIQGGPEFTGFNTLQGGTAADEFRILGGSVATINGGAGAAQDTLIGNNGTNNWSITSSDGGTVTAVTSSFSEIERMVGNDGQDNFVLSDGVAPAFIDGGDGTSDALNVSAFTTNVAVNLETGVVAGIQTSGFETFTADEALDNTLTGAPGVNTWDITSANGGQINGAITFTGFHNLTGNTGDDAFQLNGGTVSGAINGAGGTNNSLRADNVVNAWMVTGADTGTVTGVGSTFTNIATLMGNGDEDTFNVDLGASVSGGIQGGGSDDSLILAGGTNTWNITTANNGDVTGINQFDSVEVLTGGVGTDTFIVADGASANELNGGGGASDEIDVSAFTTNVAANLETGVVAGIQTSGFETFTADEALDNTLTGAPGVNTWDITSANGGQINGVITFTGFHNLTGNTGDDAFQLNGGTVSGAINGAGGTNNSLAADDVANTWNITGTDSGVVTGVASFNAVQDLIGGDLVDVFTLQGGNVTGNITGGLSDDTLNADNFANTWTITADNAGQVTGVANFASIESLVGGTSTDDFSFADGAAVSEVNGGSNGIDTMDLSDYTSTVEFNLALGLVAGMSAVNIDNVIVDNGLDNTLVGADAINDWSITGLNSGTLNGVGFTGFANLTGGGLTDTFELNGGNVTGLVNGALGEDELIAATTGGIFVVNALNAGTATNTGGFTGIENLTGNDGVDSFELAGGSLTGDVHGMGGTDDTLIADNVNNTWDIARVDGGDVTGLGQFDGIENLTGNNQEDVFNFNGGSIAGDINGVDGDDTINAADVANTFVIDGSDTGTVTNVGGRFIEIDNLNGGTGVDTFTLQGIGTLSGNINGGGETDTLTAGPVANEFVVDVANGGTVTGVTGRFDAIENLVGNSDIDRFTIVATLDGYIDGQGNMDVLVAGDRPNTLEITGENDGAATGITGGFIDIESIVGNGDTDDFVLMGGTLSGTIDGAGGINSLTADVVASSFVVNTNNGGTATGLGSGTADPDDGFANIQDLAGNDGADTFTLAGGVLDGIVDGAGGMDTLVGDNVANTFTVLTNDSGTATGLGGGTADPDDGFTSIENLTGNAQNDSFILNGGVLSGVVDGAGSDADSFTANDVDNVFEVLTDNQGTATGLGGGTVASNDGFVNVETLIGRSGDDSFSLNGGTLTGYIEGSTGNDTYHADNVANVIEVTAPNEGTATGLTDGFRGIENIIGNAQQDEFTINGGSVGTIDGAGLSDTLAVVSATGQAVTWSIDEQNNGSVDGVTGGFISFENLEGGDGNDSFTFFGADLINVDVVGGDGADEFIVQSVVNGSLQGQGGNDVYTLYDDVILNDVDGGLGDDRFVLQAGSVDVTVEGNDGSDTLEVAHALDNTWTINAIDDRVQDGAGGTARFRNVETLQGGAGVDTFNITAAFVGDIIAGANADIINLFATVTGVINGGADDDRFNINNVGIAADLVGGIGEDAIYVTHDDANVWTIDILGNQVADQSGGVATFDEMDLLVGNVRIDTFNVNTPFVGRLDGQDNDDIFNLGANVDDNDELRVDVLGGAGNDVFNLTQLNVTTTIDGQSGNDSLVIGHGFTSNWILDGVDNRVTDTAGGATRFDSIETAVGGDAIDTFNIGATFIGRIFGGANDDEFNIGADVDDSNVLTQDIVGGDGQDTFRIATTGLTVSLDGGAEDDLLVVDHTESVAWVIDGVNDRVTDADGGLVGFVGIDSLLGGTGVDVFTITAELTGSLDGRDSDDVFNLAANVNSVVYGGFGNDIFNIDTTGLTLNLNGGAGTDTVVTAHDQVAVWQLDGTANRVEDTAAGTTGFDAVEIAQGGDGVDTFNVTSTFIGQLNGAGSDDVFNLTANVTDGNALTADIVGGTGNDTVNLNAAGLVVSVDAGDGLADAIVVGHTNSSTWLLDGTNNRVEDDAAGVTAFDNVEVAQGNDSVDQFIVTAPFVGRILGQGGDDIFTLAANVSDSNILTDDVLGGLGNDQFSIEVSGLQLSINGEEGADDVVSIAHTADTQWVVDGNNNRITDVDSALLTFDGLENLQGGSGEDVMEVLVEVAGDINGRGGNDQFTLGANVTGDVLGGAGDDVFSVTAPSLVLNVIGDLGSDSIEITYNDTHAWFIDGASDRVEDSAAGVTTFSGMDMLFGSEGVDTFNINALFQGRIDARGNSDTFNIAAGVSDNLDGTDDLLGGDGDDTFNLLTTGLSLSIDAQGGTDSLAAADATNVWLIGTTNTLNNRIEFAGLENYIGGVQDDTFIMESGSVANIIRGAAIGATELAEDSLIITHAAADSAVWRITALDEGSIDGQLNGFTSIENITGGEGSDTFVFLNDTAFMTGLIDGHTSSDLVVAGNDTLRLEMLTSGVTVELGTDTTSDNLHVVNMENIIAAEDPLPADTNDTEAANRLVNNQSGNYQWVISDRNVGRIERIGSSGEESTVNFEHFGTIEAGLGEDTFLFEGAGYISGEIIGGSGNNTADYSNSLGDIVIRVGAGGISGFTTIIGNNDGSSDVLPDATLQIVSGDNTWFIEDISASPLLGVNEGRFTDGAGGATDFTFANFNNIQGGSGQDTFILNASATITGVLDGGSNIASQPDIFNSTNATVGVNVEVGGSTFGRINVANMEELSANVALSSSNTLFASESTNTWVIDGVDAGTLNGVLFDGYANLIGTDGTDSFALDGVDRITGLIDGAGGANDLADLSGLDVGDDIIVELIDVVNTDIDVFNIANVETISANPGATNTIVALDRDNTWIVNDVNAGLIERTGDITLDSSVAFSGFSQLIGGANTDDVTFTSAGVVSGSIDTGLGTTDRLDVSALANDVRVALGITAVADVNVVNVETIVANPTNINTLIADEQNNSFEIQGINSGELNSTVQFENFANIEGRDMNDQVRFDNGTVLDGYIDLAGQLEGGIDRVDMSALSQVNVTVGLGDTHVRGVELIIGNGVDSTLTVSELTVGLGNTWLIDSQQDAGTVNGEIAFERMNNLTGSINDDVFTVTNGGSVTGIISGAEGNDQFVIDWTTVIPVTTLVGGDGDDSLQLSGNLSGFQGEYTPQVSTNLVAGAEQLSYSNGQSTSYTVDFVSVESVADNVLADSFVINGTNGINELRFAESGLAQTNEFSLNILDSDGQEVQTFADIQFTDKYNVVAALGGTDAFVVDGDLFLNGGSLEVTNALVDVVDTEAELVTDSLILTSVAGVGGSANPWLTRVNDLSVSATGDVFIRERDSIVINAFDMSNDAAFVMDLAFAGNITTTAPLNSAGPVSLTTPTGDVVLDQDNNLTGELSLVASGDVVLNNTQTTTLAQVTAENFELTANGVSDVDGGAVQVNNLTTLNIVGDASLDSGLNSFNRVTVTAVDALNLVDGDLLGLTVEGVDATGAVAIQSTGMTVDGAITASTISLDAAEGALDLNAPLSTEGAAGQSDITLIAGTVNQFVDVVAQGNIVVAATGDVTMAEDTLLSAINGGVNVDATGFVNMETVTARQDIVIVSADQGMRLNQTVSSQDSAVSFSANTTVEMLADVTAQSGIQVSSVTDNVVQQGNLLVQDGELNISAGNDLQMGVDTQSDVGIGSISIDASNDVVLTQLSVGGSASETAPEIGRVTVDALGGIVNGATEGVNITADSVVMDAVTGIGSGSAVTVAVNRLSAGNDGFNETSVNIVSTQEVTIDRVHNNGDVSLTVNDGDLLIDNTNYGEYDLTAADESLGGTVDANLTGGIIDAGYRVGDVFLTAMTGNINVIEGVSFEQSSIQPVIAGQNAIVTTVEGQSGSAFDGRRLSFFVDDTIILQGRAASRPVLAFYGQGYRPRFVDNRAEFQPDLASLLLENGDLLVEVESIEAVNPAVFSEVRNYSHDQVSILMPKDQRYDDDEDDEYEDEMY